MAKKIAIAKDSSTNNAAEGAENEEDLGNLSPKTFNRAVVYSTDWTAETIRSQMRRGTIQLDPKFQRRDAWTAPRKSRFIESIILGLPIPQLVLAETPDKGFIVIDGKQRLLSLRQFAATKDEKYDQLVLEGLSSRADLNGKTLADIEKDVAHKSDFSAFQNQTIRTVVVKNWPNESYLYLVFLRLNTGSVSLSPQELRQALHPGSFTDFADDYSSQCKPLMTALNLEKPDFRMRDVELVVRYFAFKNLLSDYAGNLKGFLDTTCETFNAAWQKRKGEIVAQAEEFEKGLEAAAGIFGDGEFRKWTKDGYESRFNRAVFDIHVYYFSKPECRAAAIKNKVAVEDSFKKLCTGNARFRQSLETTTKSLEATATRFSVWGNELNRVLKLKMPVPQLRDNRIQVK